MTQRVCFFFPLPGWGGVRHWLLRLQSFPTLIVGMLCDLLINTCRLITWQPNPTPFHLILSHNWLTDAIYRFASLSISHSHYEYQILEGRTLEMDKFEVDTASSGISALQHQPSLSLRLHCHCHRSRSRTRVGRWLLPLAFASIEPPCVVTASSVSLPLQHPSAAALDTSGNRDATMLHFICWIQFQEISGDVFQKERQEKLMYTN